MVFVNANAKIQKDLLPNMVSLNEMNLSCSACMIMISLKLINDCSWRFVSERDIISEDIYSLIDLFANVKSAAIISEDFYNYCRNENSLTRTYSEERFEKIKIYYDRCIEMCKGHGYGKRVFWQVGDSYFSNTIAALKQIMMSSAKLSDKYEKIKAIILDSHLQETVRKVDITKGSRPRRILMKTLMKRKCRTAFVLVLLGCIRNGR